MGKRFLILVAMVAGIALLIAGVAFAAGDLASSDEPTTTTATALEPPVVGDSTTSTTASTETPAVAEEVTVNAVPTSPHDGDWGTYISGLREQGDRTPAAVLMGKTVPGWEKKHPPTTDTPTTQAPAAEEGATQATTAHGHGHGKK